MIWTAADYARAKAAAFDRDDWDRLRILAKHYPHADHCGGYDVYAWPCPVAAQILDHLLGDNGEPNPCGHLRFEPGCGGCDPSAIDYEFGDDA